MDIERKLQQLARAHAESDVRWEKRTQDAEKRLALHDRRMAELDKKIKATRDLIHAGMKMIVRMGRETDYRINALIDAQQRNEAGIADLKRLMEAQIRRSSNGHSKR